MARPPVLVLGLTGQTGQTGQTSRTGRTGLTGRTERDCASKVAGGLLRRSCLSEGL